MTTLYIIGAIMALVAMLFVALPLLRHRKPDVAPAQDAANVAIYSDQIAELENDLSNGLLSQAQFDLAKPELERRLLQDVPVSFAEKPATQSARWFGVTLSLLVPLLAVGIYFQLGAPDAINAPAAVDQTASEHNQEIEAILPQLLQHLQNQPDDIAAWKNLGRALLALQRFDEAAQAFEKITQITPNSAAAFADYADSLGMAQGQKLAGKPTQVIAQALKLDPKNPKALYLSGFASIEAGNLKEAIKHWETLLAQLPPEQRGVDTLREKIADLKQQAGLASPTAEAATAVKPTDGATVTISGQARLSPALKSQASPEDTVFVFARAVQGPKMPLALMRVQVKDLPVEFKLDDSMAMSPQMKLSNFPDVVIVARVSKSGTAITQPGDLEGVSAPVKLGARNVKIEISRKIE